MSTAYELHGRTAQKQRTREALLAAAHELLAAGATPSVETAAEAAGISKTTAYRYFPNQRSLLLATHPELDASSLLPQDAPSDAEARLALVVDEFLQIIRTSEAQQRATLRVSLRDGEPARDLPLRQGRGIRWLTDALEPDRELLGDAALRRLVLAIRTTIGIEALVWLVDVAGLSRAKAFEQMRWTALALYRGAIAEASPRP